MKPKPRRHRVCTVLNAEEKRAPRKARRYVWGFTGDRTTAEALRFLIRNWSDR